MVFDAGKYDLNRYNHQVWGAKNQDYQWLLVSLYSIDWDPLQCIVRLHLQDNQPFILCSWFECIVHINIILKTCSAIKNGVLRYGIIKNHYDVYFTKYT